MALQEIPGFKNYKIDSRGRVHSTCVRRGPNKQGTIILKPGKARGHLFVHLVKDKKPFMRYIHRLVAEAFIPNDFPHIKKNVNHKDGDSTNNDVSNLYWGTQSENSRDAIRHGTHPGFKNRGENNHMAKLKKTDIFLIRKLIENSKLSKCKIGELFGVSRGAIRKIAEGKSWLCVN